MASMSNDERLWEIEAGIAEVLEIHEPESSEFSAVWLVGFSDGVRGWWLEMTPLVQLVGARETTSGALLRVLSKAGA